MGVGDAAFGVLVSEVVELLVQRFRVVVEVDKNVKAVQHADHVCLELTAVHVVDVDRPELLLRFRHDFEEADVTEVHVHVTSPLSGGHAVWVSPREDCHADRHSAVAEARTPDHGPRVEHGFAVFVRAAVVVGDRHRDEERQEDESAQHGRN